MKSKNVIVKRSRINGRGVFAGKDFRKGSIVLRWCPNVITKEDVEELPKRELRFVEKVGRKLYFMQPPERYVNHSCDANTLPQRNCDVARRNIKKGEEITSSYFGHELVSFKCRRGNERCRKIIE